MDWTMPLIWLIIMIVSIILEAVSGQFISIWFVLGSIVTFAVSFFNIPVIWQIVVFFGVSIISLIATRPFVKKVIKLKVEDTNLGRCVGKVGIVTEDIGGTESKGQVKVLGNVWTAISSDNRKIPAGAEVTIIQIDGVKLIVEPVKTLV